MIAVDEVDVSASRRTEQHSVACCLADRGVCSGIIRSEVGFNFNDASSEQLTTLAADENLAEQVRSDEARVAVVEGAGKDVHGRVVRHPCPRKLGEAVVKAVVSGRGRPPLQNHCLTPRPSALPSTNPALARHGLRVSLCKKSA